MGPHSCSTRTVISTGALGIDMVLRLGGLDDHRRLLVIVESCSARKTTASNASEDIQQGPVERSILRMTVLRNGQFAGRSARLREE